MLSVKFFPSARSLGANESNALYESHLVRHNQSLAVKANPAGQYRLCCFAFRFVVLYAGHYAPT